MKILLCLLYCLMISKSSYNWFMLVVSNSNLTMKFVQLYFFITNSWGDKRYCVSPVSPINLVPPQGCVVGVGVTRSRRFLGGVRVGFLTT